MPRAIVVLIMGGVFLAAVAAPSGAADQDRNSTFASEGAWFKRVTVTVNKSLTVDVERVFTRTIVGAPELADVLPLSERSIYIQGKKVGTTNVSLFDARGNLVGVLDVQIALDTAGLQQKIRVSGCSRGIQVSSVGSQIVLSGVACDAVAADRAVQIAKSLSGSNEVVNTMQVAPSQQVLLEVRILEAERTAGTALGVNWWGSNANGTQSVSTGLGGLGQLNPAYCTLTTPPPLYCTIAPALLGAATLPSTTASPFGTILSQVLSKNGTTVNAMVTALEQKGLVRTLAEPNLIALSGDTASFLVGGKFPMPSVQSSSGTSPVITTQLTPYGVQLNFRPTVLNNGIINLFVNPIVSELDYTNAVTIAGTTVPSLSDREATTTLELRDGQSFALAGLLQETNSNNISQFPWLGSVPVLGTLFSSKAYQKNETDLVVIVTAHLVAPAAPGQRLASPLDSRLPSNDVDFFLNGQPEVRKRYQDYVSSGGELKGPYGHIIEDEPGSTITVQQK